MDRILERNKEGAFINLILIRHVESVYNAQNRIPGSRVKGELTEKGIKQANKIAKRLKDLKLVGIYCSDALRSFKTAKIIARFHNLCIKKFKGLREIDVGKYEGLKVKKGDAKWRKRLYKELKKKKMKIEKVRPPGGESLKEHKERVMKTVNKILQNHERGNVVIVGHGKTNKVIIGSLFGLKPLELYKLPQGNGCINIIKIKEEKSRLRCLNDCSHL